MGRAFPKLELVGPELWLHSLREDKVRLKIWASSERRQLLSSWPLMYLPASLSSALKLPATKGAHAVQFIVGLEIDSAHLEDS